MFDAMDLWPLSIFQPKWKKEAKHLLKGAKKFIHYKRDLLKQDRIDEIESRRTDLQDARQKGDREAADEASKQLRATCEKSLAAYLQQTWWEENVEVLFVALVVALGLRTYVLQPFRIPTGSMQPTLNGIVIESGDPNFEKPWFGRQAWDLVVSGKSYKDIVADADKQVIGSRDASWFLFTRTELTFSDGSRLKIPSAEGEVSRLVGLRPERDSKTGRVIMRGNTYKKGDPILRGTIVTGDLVLVDRISYHFRSPKRGEVFVFDTRGLTTGGNRTSAMRDQTGGSHYIKRLCGVPGDALQIDEPNLLVNGKLAQAPGIVRVMEREGIYGGPGRPGYRPAGRAQTMNYRGAPLVEPDDIFKLKDEAPQGMREYAALGDNTDNSLDSRYWGAVHEFNLVGPGWFSLWPFGSGHWGFIR
jgi:signal peptidase I